MPVTECYEYEGKNVEQLAAIFNEKNINLSIISPRKIPILYEIFEKSGGDLGLTAKNYSKDPRHLVLLKGFSLKELIIHDKRSESPPANQAVTQAPQQPPQATQAPPAQPQQQQQPNLQQMMQQGNVEPQMVQMPQNTLGGMQNQGMRQMTPNVRPPMMSQGQQQANQQQAQPNVMQQMANQTPQFAGPMGNLQGQRVMNPQQQQQQQQQNPQQQRWMAPNQPNPQRQQFIQGMMNAVGGNMMQNQNSALISQLNQPPSLAQPNPMGGPQQQNQNPQQQPQTPNMMRVPMPNQQQQNPVMMQNQPQNPNMAMQNPNMMAPNQQVGMMQQQAGQQPGPMNQLQQNPQGGVPQQQQQQQQQMAQRERIWRGILEWNDKQNQQNQVRQVPCEIYASISRETNEVEIRGDTWPNRLIMQLMPRTVISNVGGQLLRDAKVVQFSWGNSEAFESLSKVMSNGFAGCVHFTGHQQCDVKILILLYMADKKSYYGKFYELSEVPKIIIDFF